MPDSCSETPKPSRREFLRRTAAGLVGGTLSIQPLASEGALARPPVIPRFESRWPEDADRVWIGPDYWANPLQDWRLSGGRLELIGAGERRNVHLLTARVGARSAGLEMITVVGRTTQSGTGRAGFEIGIRGPLDEYRSDAVHGRGLAAGVDLDGRLFIGQAAGPAVPFPERGTELHLRLMPAGDDYVLTLSGGGETMQQEVAAEDVEGGLALFADFEDEAAWGAPRLWFGDWVVDGDKLELHPERAFGPTLFAQHTLSRGVLKLTAQQAPVGSGEPQTVRLQMAGSGTWETVAEAEIDALARTATFRVEGWDASTDVPYRITYDLLTADGLETQVFEGTIRREPVDRDTLVVAGLSCATDTGFPHPSVAGGALHHDPDLVAFTGDQLYENSGGYGVQRHRENVALSTLDYLRKWYLHGWAFGELMRERPTICITDDHDVYQGNIWGEGGPAVETYDAHNDGGFFMPAEWVNMVQRTQTSHLPDPYDPTPVEQGITVYYTDLLYGRVSFAILEDRKWKSGPDGLVPPTTSGRPDHVVDPEADPAALDVPGAVLLGSRQHAFLEDWGADWRGADLKIVVSQSVLAAVPTHHGPEKTWLAADLDSNSWPQTPRNEALRLFRKSTAFHLGGDQHLPMILRYGIDTWDDAGYNFSVPAISTGYPRWFLPEEPPAGGASDLTGRYRDGLGNLVTVDAVANPAATVRSGPIESLVDKSSGYGILRLDKAAGDITMEAWPILSDPDGGAQYPGWPQTVNILDQDGREAASYLPAIVVDGGANPMVQVVDEERGEILYTLRARGTSVRPKVFRAGTYTVRVGDEEAWRVTFEGVVPDGGQEELRVQL